MREREGRVLFGVTAPVTAQIFLKGQLAHLNAEGWEVHLVCGAPGLTDFALLERVTSLHEVAATREPSWRDAVVLARLVKLIRAVRPDVVVMGTPKIGVFGTLASFVARVPVRVYVIHGYRGELTKGPLGILLRGLERLACRFATQVIAVGPSLRSVLVADRIVRAGKVTVLAGGSANGIDLHRFTPGTSEDVNRCRDSLGIPRDAGVVAFVGRLTADKGIVDLVAVWKRLMRDQPNAWLVVAGDPESSGATDQRAINSLRRSERVIFLGHTDAIENVYRAASVVIVLSKREGLMTVPLEAAACGIPTVAYRATGVVDAVAQDTTGWLKDQSDVEGVSQAVATLLANERIRLRLGASAREWVEQRFDQEVMWKAWADLLRPHKRRRGVAGRGAHQQ